ncbi:MAG TPA: glycosyltransferase family 2 protein [Terrimicrobiaceae bacterium]|nr:glycosyltransferase family 2 protein [Terrimicrobiaceae bacterium]
MNSISERPLITFVICAYKHEQYIAQAIQGAFQQTYSPLEIILSDDCSPDGTFRVMQEMAAAYRGPHQIVLNRNSTNLGLAEHSNLLFRRARGEIFIGSAGDDVSLPERTAETYEAFERNKDWTMVVSHVEMFGSKQGIRFSYAQDRRQSLLEACWSGQLAPSGCSASYRTWISREFPPLEPWCLAEDMAYAFRSALLGANGTIPKVLVRYRAAEGSLTHSYQDPDFERKYILLGASGLRQNLVDLDEFCRTRKIRAPLARFLLEQRIHLLTGSAVPSAYSNLKFSPSVTRRLLNAGKILKVLHPIQFLQRRLMVKKTIRKVLAENPELKAVA